MPRLTDLVQFDQDQGQGEVLLAGIDEAGRGPLAGPVVACAVILFRYHGLEGLGDSKQVSKSQREKLYRKILSSGMIGFGVADEKLIDEINIYQATRVAMERAVNSLRATPQRLVIDGKMRLNLPLAQKSIVKGDGKSAAIAAASIIAKVYRDCWMEHLDELYPGYDFVKHKGYPTKHHVDRLKAIGPSPIHRRTFSPVSEMVEAVSA